MKRDMELIRKILINVEETDAQDLIARDFEVEGFDMALVAQHVQVLEDAGFIEATVIAPQTVGPIKARVRRLTWEGHEFLDAARNERIWKKALDYFKKQGLSVPLDVMKLYLMHQVKQALGMEPPA